MKSLKKYFFIALTGILFTSCGGRAIEPAAEESDGTFTADVNGKSWRTQEVTAFTIFGSLVISADRNDGSNIVITFLGKEPKVSTYILPDNTQNSLSGVTYTSENGEFTAIPTSGRLEITKFLDNRVVEGKLEFEGTDFNGNTVSVKNGKFNVAITP